MVCRSGNDLEVSISDSLAPPLIALTSTLGESARLEDRSATRSAGSETCICMCAPSSTTRLADSACASRQKRQSDDARTRRPAQDDQREHATNARAATARGGDARVRRSIDTSQNALSGPCGCFAGPVSARVGRPSRTGFSGRVGASIGDRRRRRRSPTRGLVPRSRHPHFSSNSFRARPGGAGDVRREHASVGGVVAQRGQLSVTSTPGPPTRARRSRSIRSA
jgi:hypothetical protein